MDSQREGMLEGFSLGGDFLRRSGHPLLRRGRFLREFHESGTDGGIEADFNRRANRFRPISHQPRTSAANAGQTMCLSSFSRRHPPT